MIQVSVSVTGSGGLSRIYFARSRKIVCNENMKSPSHFIRERGAFFPVFRSFVTAKATTPLAATLNPNCKADRYGNSLGFCLILLEAVCFHFLCCGSKIREVQHLMPNALQSDDGHCAIPILRLLMMNRCWAKLLADNQKIRRKSKMHSRSSSYNFSPFLHSYLFTNSNLTITWF